MAGPQKQWMQRVVHVEARALVSVLICAHLGVQVVLRVPAHVVLVVLNPVVRGAEIARLHVQSPVEKVAVKPAAVSARENVTERAERIAGAGAIIIVRVVVLVDAKAIAHSLVEEIVAQAVVEIVLTVVA